MNIAPLQGYEYYQSQRIPSMVSTERAQNICSIFFLGLMPHDPNLLNLQAPKGSPKLQHPHPFCDAGVRISVCPILTVHWSMNKWNYYSTYHGRRPVCKKNQFYFISQQHPERSSVVCAVLTEAPLLSSNFPHTVNSRYRTRWCCSSTMDFRTPGLTKLPCSWIHIAIYQEWIIPWQVPSPIFPVSPYAEF